MITNRRKVPARTAVLFIRDLPRDVKDQFKAWCARRGITMTDQITNMMKELIREDNKVEIPRRASGTLDSL